MKKDVSAGICMWSLLGITFVVLKLCGVIDWNWFLVVLPFFAPCLIVVIILVAAFSALIAAQVIDYFIGKRF